VNRDSILIIEVYVDDIIIRSDDDRMSRNFSKDMHNEFDMSPLGELYFFLGLQIYHRSKGIFISQTKYVIERLKKFGMTDYKPVNTPMKTSCKLSKYGDCKDANQRQYKSMIGNLFHVTTSRMEVM
jgi:hypothetical protein